MDSSAKEKMQDGDDPRTLELWEVGAGATMRAEDTTKETVPTPLASKAKGLSKGEGKPRHHSIECPHPQKSESKGKGFQGECHNCGENGHPARDRPKCK